MQDKKIIQTTENTSHTFMVDVWEAVKEFLNFGLHIGEGSNRVDITIGLALLVVVSFFVTSFVLKWSRKIFTRKMDETDKRKFISLFNFIKYIAYSLVFFAVLSLGGINITPFLAASAALLVGVGLALQQFFQDILGGVFIILDKSLLVGDIIEVDGKVCQVIEIKLRTTRAITRDDKIIIIPNHKFIIETIYNYTQNQKITRESITVGVAYGSDTLLVKQLLLQSVSKELKVLKQPKPFVAFEDFGDSALIFTVYFFISDSFHVPIIKSDIRFTIDKLFRKNNITIPFPQRDVHIFQTKN